jgi:hypothetical protein
MEIPIGLIVTLAISAGELLAQASQSSSGHDLMVLQLANSRRCSTWLAFLAVH